MPDEKIIKAKRHILQETDGVKEYATVSQYTLADSVEFDSDNAIKNGLSLSESLWEGTTAEYEADFIAGKIAEGATVHITDDHEDVEQDPINIDNAMSSTSQNPVQNKVITNALTSETNRATNAESTITNSINSESNRAKSAETSLDNRITAIEKLESGWNDKYSKEEIDAKFSALETATDWKEAVNTFADIATTYPNPQDGWTVNVKDTDYTYRYDGSKWIATSANAIPDATQSISGKMSASDKKKLDGIATGAEVNQNAFSNVIVGSTTVSADSKTDTLTLVAGSNVTLTPDATNDKITIAAKDTTYSGSNGVTITGTSITNSGVRSVSEGSADGTISVNTNGSSANVSVHGLKSGAFTNYVIGTKSQISSASIPVGSIVDITDDYDAVDNTPISIATSSTPGIVKSGTDITVDSSGNVSVNDDSHNHVISNVDGLQTALNGKANTSHGNHVPTTETANNARFLRNDNTWQTVTPANIGAATSSHTHNYAGSSSAGGSANSAVKLDTASAGSATQPVYFTGGKPSACSYTLSKSVPSNAVFTDTVTTVSSDSNSNSTTIAASTSLVYSLKNGLSKSLVSTETINIDSLSLSSGGHSTITSEEISKSGYTLVGAKFFLRGSYTENIIASFTIGGSNTKIYNFAFYNPSDYNILAFGYVDLIYVANSL